MKQLRLLTPYPDRIEVWLAVDNSPFSLVASIEATSEGKLRIAVGDWEPQDGATATISTSQEPFALQLDFEPPPPEPTVN